MYTVLESLLGHPPPELMLRTIPTDECIRGAEGSVILGLTNFSPDKSGSKWKHLHS
jgi:hypothetical protein